MNTLYRWGLSILAFLGAVLWLRRDAVNDERKEKEAEKDKAEIKVRKKADEIREDVERTDADERRERLRDKYTRK